MKKILLVEDDENVSKALKYVLAEEGYEVIASEDGKKGLELALSARPDLILLDIMLPSMDGIEVCRFLKSNSLFKSIPIILMTGLGDTENIVKGLSAGANDYLSKPFEMRELLARVTSHLKVKELYDIVKEEEEEKSVLLNVSKSLASTMHPYDTLYTIVSKIAEIIEVKRCSIIYVDPAKKKGTVMASHDSRDIKHLEIDLEKYPEIQKIMETGEPVIVNDVYTDPILFSVREVLNLIDVKSIMAFPVAFKDTLIGTLVLRTSRRESPFNEREIRFCEVISNLAASPLKNAYLFEIIHEEKEAEKSGRLEAEDALRKNEEKFRVLYENIPVPYQSLDENGCFLEVNRVFLETLGYSRDEIIGSWFGDLIAPHDLERFKENFARFKEAGEVNELEFELKKKDGSLVAVLYTGRIGYDLHGKFKQMYCIWEDITERRRTQETLRMTKFAVDRASDAVFWVDPEARFIKVNEAACESLGYSREELLSMTVHDIDPQFPKEIWAKHWEESRRRGSFTVESIQKTRDGKIFPVEIMINFLHFKGKEYNCSFVRDISDRKRYEKMLEKAAKDWDNTFDSITDFVSIHDGDFRIVKANKALLAFLGMRLEEIKGKYCYEVFHKKSEPWETCPHAQTLESRESKTEEVIDANIGRPLLVTTCPIFDEKGNIQGSVHIAKDISEQKKKEEEFKKLSRLNELVLGAAGEGIYGLDSEGKTTFVNPAVSRMTGWNPEELIGKKHHDILHHSYPDGTPYPREKCPIYASFKDGKVHHVDNEVFWKKDGTCFPVEYLSTPIQDEHEKLIGSVVVFRDITERKKTETELKKRTESLEKFQQITVGRELEMVKLKREINSLLGELGRPRKYEEVDETGE